MAREKLIYLGKRLALVCVLLLLAEFVYGQGWITRYKPLVLFTFAYGSIYQLLARRWQADEQTRLWPFSNQQRLLFAGMAIISALAALTLVIRSQTGTPIYAFGFLAYGLAFALLMELLYTWLAAKRVKHKEKQQKLRDAMESGNDE